MIPAGDLRHRITIFAPFVTTNDVGEEIEAWTALHTVWAARRSLALREVNRVAGTAEAAEIKFEVRYRTGIDTAMRLEDGGNRYGITAVEEIGNREGLALFARRT